MIVGLDIDGVVADFISPFLRFLEKRVGKGPIGLDSITDLNFSNHPFLSEEIVVECIQNVSDDPKFWQGLAPLPTTSQWKLLDDLSRQRRLIFVTHRYERESYSIHQVTCDWLEQHGVSQPVVHFTQTYKSELIGKLNIELFVDDRHENCRDVAEKTPALVFMPHRTYNQSFEHPRVQRIQDLDELFAYLDREPAKNM
jgi:deoxypyrimidine-specific 5' nucleotidase type C protein (NT5C)